MNSGRLAAWYFLYFAFLGVYLPYFSVYLHTLGYSAWQISLLLALMQLMRLAAPNLWSRLAEIDGRSSRVIQGSTLFCLLCFLALFLVRGFNATFIVIALLCFFWSAALPLIEALTLEQLGQNPERYGRIRMWGSIGFIVTVQLTGNLLEFLSIDLLLWWLLAWLILLWASTRRLPEGHLTHTSQGPVSLRNLLQRPGFVALLWATFLMAAAHGPLYVFLSIHLIQKDYSTGWVGALWSLGVIAEILAFMWMPQLLRAFQIQTLLLLTFVAAMLRFLLIAWFAHSLPLILFAQLLHGLTFGVFHGAMISILRDWFPGREQPRAQALYGSISFGAGGLIGSLLAGQSWESFGGGWTFTLCAGFALTGWLILQRIPLRLQAAAR